LVDGCIVRRTTNAKRATLVTLVMINGP
jgi:hypothetical protein